MEMAAALAQLSSGEGGGDGRGRGGELGSSGRPFYRRPGRRRGVRWRAPASSPRRRWWCTMVTTRWLGQTGQRNGSGRRKAPNRAGERDNGEATERAVASDDRVARPGHGREEGTDGRGPLARERSRESEGVWADGWGRPVNRESGTARGRELGRVGRGKGARGRELGRKRPNRGGEGFSFFFSIFYVLSIFYFYFFYPLFLLNK
jgi:hypothetical protein